MWPKFALGPAPKTRPVQDNGRRRGANQCDKDDDACRTQEEERHIKPLPLMD